MHAHSAVELRPAEVVDLADCQRWLDQLAQHDADPLAAIDRLLHALHAADSPASERLAMAELVRPAHLRAIEQRMSGVHSEAVPMSLADRRQLKVAEGYWLAVLDIDHFKRVNDNFGHLIGDEVLLLMARLMRSSFRFHDQLYRFGGEEFVILMRCAGHDDAQAVLNRFRRTVEAYAFPQVGTITVSIGFAPLQGDDTPSAAFGRADKAVYFAKGHGRNQVCSYPQLVAAGDLEQEVEASGEADFF
jgi:diguanylate cyclase (GGDEF)-like protein